MGLEPAATGGAAGGIGTAAAAEEGETSASLGRLVVTGAGAGAGLRRSAAGGGAAIAILGIGGGASGSRCVGTGVTLSAVRMLRPE